MLQCGRLLLIGMRTEGSSVMSTAKNEVVRVSGKLNRNAKEQSRECELAAAFYKEGTRSGFRKLAKLITKQKNVSEVTSRSAAFAAALALKLGKVQEAHQMLSHVTMSPPVIRRSLVVSVLTNEGRLDDALDEVEKCLHEEDIVFNSENSCISNEALDQLCNAIKERTDTQKQMKRFRSLQRVLTDYDRRTSKSIDELLHSPLHIASTEEDFAEDSPKIPLTDKMIGQVPHFLSKED
ncbi:hypothetical protein KIN20_006873 [Parelaphostrongylus tenuis]|uniref:Uncharacterized protein n=1 Tax=Parelaphostrongylus tenuis TaxID=148309 RepID=A0AAD5M6Q8_PARTN|nr:hypothetical protein KIN20_006873 [Parelaphostrongylus tenuis]